MNLKVVHSLQYAYTGQVILLPHTLYLYPKSYPHQKLLNYQLYVDPFPTQIVKNVDAEGNVQQVLHFAKIPFSYLTVTSEITVSSDPLNVFDFVLFPYSTRTFPFTYESRIFKYLAPYLNTADVTRQVEQFARNVAIAANWNTVQFLVDLCQHISGTFSYSQREYGPALPPSETINYANGSCRDFARLYIACCRCLGIAARFVSGYLYGSPLQAHELHAWVEVYLPGAGWRGFDPTEGKAIIHNHVSLGASADYDQLAPVMGTFEGYVNSSLTTTLNIELQN